MEQQSIKQGSFKFQATWVGSETALAQIIKMVEDAQASKAPIQKLADFVAGHFIAGVHVLALIVFFFWFFIGYTSFFSPESQFILSPYSLAQVGVFGFSLLLSVTTLIISCPCALGLLNCLYEKFESFVQKLYGKPKRKSRGRQVIDQVKTYEEIMRQVMSGEQNDLYYDC